MQKSWANTIFLFFGLLTIGQAQSIKSLEDLVSITLYEQTLVPLEFTFQINSPELNMRLTDPLGNARSDFQGWDGNEFFQDLANGDSLVRINLEFGNQITKEETYQGCEGDGYSITINDNTYNESLPRGVEFLSSNTGGCDTMVNINLIFQPLASRTVNYTGCEGDPFSFVINGVVYDESNPIGMEVISNPGNTCDSLIIIDLIFNQQVNLLERYNGCQGDGYNIVINGTLYDEVNPNGMEVLSGLNGTCDTLVSIELSFSKEISRLESYTGCQGDDYNVLVNGIVYDETNPSGTTILTSSQACDTLVTIDLNFRDCSLEQTPCEIFVPNAFSPNNDGVNDIFQIFTGQNCLMESFTIQVFNRWGTIVFASDDPNFNWDGRIGGRLLGDEVLIWKIKYQLIGAPSPTTTTGSIMLLT